MRERTTAVLLSAIVALGAMTGVAAADSRRSVTVDDDDSQSNHRLYGGDRVP